MPNLTLASSMQTVPQIVVDLALTICSRSAAASQTRAVLSQLAVTTRAVGAERGAQHLCLVLEGLVRSWPLARPRPAALSLLAVITRVLSGLNATLPTCT